MIYMAVQCHDGNGHCSYNVNEEATFIVIASYYVFIQIIECSKCMKRRV